MVMKSETPESEQPRMLAREKPEQGDIKVQELREDMLPAITGRHLDRAQEEDMISWASGMFDHLAPGLLHLDSKNGFVLQVLHPSTVRVIQAWDNIATLSVLSQTIESFRAAGFIVEVDGHAHLTPMLPPSMSSNDNKQEGGESEDDVESRVSESGKNKSMVGNQPRGGEEAAVLEAAHVRMWR